MGRTTSILKPAAANAYHERKKQSLCPQLPMASMLKTIATAICLSAIAAPALAQSTPPDREGVISSALDYINGFYEGDSTKHIRSIHPSVYKYGFARSGTGYRGMQMTWPEFHAFTRDVRSRGPKRSPVTESAVQVLDIADQIAAVKVTAYWGIDYLLMGRIDGHWMITHVIWQTPPPASR